MIRTKFKTVHKNILKKYFFKICEIQIKYFLIFADGVR